MDDTTGRCAFDECDRVVHAKSLCDGHYWQRRRGRPLIPLRPKRNRSQEFASSFWDRVQISDGCWLWDGADDGRQGYGVVWRDGRLEKAHRVAWEMDNGPIPRDQMLDHTCHVRACVRPTHLRLATAKQNAENVGMSPRNTSGFKGARRYRDGVRWLAEVVHRGRKIYLGIYDTAEEAGEVARAKRAELFTHNDADRAEVTS
jgi:hypothetical protein